MKLLLQFLLLIVIFYFGDMVSTWYMLNHGWVELNPMGVYGMVTAKTVLLILLYFSLPYLRSWKVSKFSFGLFLSRFTYLWLILGSIAAMTNNFLMVIKL